MYGIAKLSPESQDFLKVTTDKDLIAHALAKAIANVLPLPSSPVESPVEHNLSSNSVAVKRLVSDVNEVAVIDTKLVVELISLFWQIRYHIAHPSSHVFNTSAESVEANFFGYGSLLTPVLVEYIRSNGAELVRATNTFNKIIAELTEVSRDEEAFVQQTSIAATGDE